MGNLVQAKKLREKLNLGKNDETKTAAKQEKKEVKEKKLSSLTLVELSAKAAELGLEIKGDETKAALVKLIEDRQKEAKE